METSKFCNLLECGDNSVLCVKLTCYFILFSGIVIQMIDDRMSPATAKLILQGKADPLNSAFRLTYNMVCGKAVPLLLCTAMLLSADTELL